MNTNKSVNPKPKYKKNVRIGSLAIGDIVRGWVDNVTVVSNDLSTGSLVIRLKDGTVETLKYEKDFSDLQVLIP